MLPLLSNVRLSHRSRGSPHCQNEYCVLTHYILLRRKSTLRSNNLHPVCKCSEPTCGPVLNQCIISLLCFNLCPPPVDRTYRIHIGMSTFMYGLSLALNPRLRPTLLLKSLAVKFFSLCPLIIIHHMSRSCCSSPKDL
jgi:hypothetical protein